MGAPSESAGMSVTSWFPGRTFLRIREVAKLCLITPNQVVRLIEDGSFQAVDFRGEKSKSKRSTWRVPVESVQTFLERRKNV